MVRRFAINDTTRIGVNGGFWSRRKKEEGRETSRERVAKFYLEDTEATTIGGPP
jgi:hypothetical protein